MFKESQPAGKEISHARNAMDRNKCEKRGSDGREMEREGGRGRGVVVEGGQRERESSVLSGAYDGAADLQEVIDLAAVFFRHRLHPPLFFFEPV